MGYLKRLALLFVVSILLIGCSGQSSQNHPLPLVEAAGMPEDQIADTLNGFAKEDLAQAWGAPDMELSGMNGEVYSFEFQDRKGHLTVYYDDESHLLTSVKKVTENIGESVPFLSVDLEQLTADAILSANRENYPGEECIGEGHIILESEEQSDGLTVYALTMYGEYQFQDGNFVKAAGSGVVPAVITFSSDGEGGYLLTSLTYPEDGSNYQKSIQAMFPETWWDACISPSESAHEQLKSMEESYAYAYLNQLGRPAPVGEYRDFEHPLLTEQGVNSNVSNILVENKDLDRYPYWIGNIERLEDGSRYVYALDFDKENKKIFFTKKEYGTENIIESYTYDSDTGLLLSPEAFLHEASSENQILTEPPALVFQDALSSTMNEFKLTCDTASWNYRQETDDTIIGFVSCGAHPLTIARQKEHLKLPQYNKTDSVCYLVSSLALPDRILVHEYELPSTPPEEPSEDMLVSTKTYEDSLFIELKPGMGYAITAEWDKEQLDARGFYGTGYYSLITE